MGTNKGKKQKRFEKFVEKQVKKEERVALLEKLSTSVWTNDLMRSSKTLGRQKETRRENLHRAALEERLGMARSDPSVRLYVSERDPADVRRQADSMPRAIAAADSVPAVPEQGLRRGRNRGSRRGPAEIAGDAADDLSDMAIGEQKAESADAAAGAAQPGSLKRPPEETAPGSALATLAITKRKRQKKGRVLEQLGLVEARSQSDDRTCSRSASPESEFDSSASENEDAGEDKDQDEGDGAMDGSGPEDGVQPSTPAAAAAQETAPTSTRQGPRSHSALKMPYMGSMLKPLLASRGLAEGAEHSSNSGGGGVKAYYVPVERPEHIQSQRIGLPVYAEEQQIMEAIAENPAVVLSGETGSGKTTQVPQFLFEAGYSDPGSPNPGMIGVTQPRRVAAVSMAHRVAEELGNFGHTVAHQVRFDTTVSNATRVKFMTEGVLLRELAADLLLTKYSVIIADEAHERSLNTDILLGVLSRVVRLRQKLSLESPAKHRPLKLIIMSATLRVDDFVKNTRLFRAPPPVLNVQARQHPVRVHFSRRTPAPGQHVHDAIQKAAKIHTRLPDGGILMFLTGQAEITFACKRLRELFPSDVERAAQSRSAGAQRAPAPPAGGAANGLEASVEDEDVDIGDADILAASGELRDDFASDPESASDSEEEDEIIVGGGDADSEARKTLLQENLRSVPERAGAAAGHDEDAHKPLYVLPLYSLLPADQQLKVFAPPPAGSRLCVIATNVAETSITIPGIRYVVDAGLVKEKTYDAQTQVQSFEVGWASQASANQRMGRAGRTGPGHCYRLFSSAVFNDQFARFSEPEVLRMPIEGVVLQMKAMNLDNVTNFPFPTPPRREALEKAERLLTWLGALDERGRATDLGRLMAAFPVAPRFAKMLIVGQQHGCLPYVIAVVAALSVGDPFVKEFHLDADADDGIGGDSGDMSFADQVADAEAQAVTNEALAAKEQQRAKRRKYWGMQAKLAGADPTSDLLKWLAVVGAFEYAGGTDAVCSEYFVRAKAMGEIRKLRGQLTNIVQMYCPGVDVSMDPRMPPPTKLQQSVLRQVILAGFMDQVAVRGDIAGYHDPDDEAATRQRGLRAVPYMTMWSDEPVFIHPGSVVHIAARNTGSMPQAVVYSELQRTTRLWAKAVTVAGPRWLATIGRPLCTFGNPLPYPLPKYNDARDEMTCYVEPRFGPRSWPLAMVKVQEKRSGTRWHITSVLG
ncbi:putative ATP-dependent RNA helicase DHR1 [Coemansia biformis]|uniref:RNA helicase n=1 Tax=Coemansia biformis TaxID=1286918 RepID=A0A9W8D0X0_9FUNG|nr:putative ATP-dependent RNA helicase DHR1 [Coemansia biformis]